MKWNRVTTSLVLALAMLATTGAFAAGSSGSLHLSEAAQISGQALPAGEYKLRWEGTGSNVELSVMQGKKVVAKVPARLIESKDAYPYDSAVVDRASSTPAVKEVRFAGKKYALEIATEKAEMGESSSRIP